MLLFIFFLLAQGKEQPRGECEDDNLCVLYSKALEIAKTPTFDRIYRKLTSIRYTNEMLKFDSEGRVLMATVGLLYSFPYTPGSQITLSQETWFTVHPDLQNACKYYKGNDKSQRMVQQLGLPPYTRITVVAEFYVNLNDIFRPCPDPEITDSECLLSVPVYNNNSSEPEVPWYCPHEDEGLKQVSSRWIEVEKRHFEWMCNTWKDLYKQPEIYNNYPWTGLGYTYDWASEHGYGLSEFVVAKGKTVIFQDKYDLNKYCLL